LAKPVRAPQPISGSAAGNAVKPHSDIERASAIEDEIALRKAQDHRSRGLADVSAC